MFQPMSATQFAFDPAATASRLRTTLGTVALHRHSGDRHGPDRRGALDFTPVRAPDRHGRSGHVHRAISRPRPARSSRRRHTSAPSRPAARSGGRLDVLRSQLVSICNEWPAPSGAGHSVIDHSFQLFSGLKEKMYRAIASLPLIAAIILSASCTADGAARSARSAADSVRADSIARARQDSINRTLPGYVVDSIFPVAGRTPAVPRGNRRRQRYQAGWRKSSREELVRRFVAQSWPTIQRTCAPWPFTLASSRTCTTPIRHTAILRTTSRRPCLGMIRTPAPPV